jgi:hypothetical protein
MYLGNLISYENEMDIGNKLDNYLKITGIINNVFRLKKARIKLYNTLALPTLLYGSENWTTKARCKNNNSSRDEICEKNSRMHSDRSENKYKDYKVIKYNPSFGQNMETQEKLDITYKSNAA